MLRTIWLIVSAALYLVLAYAVPRQQFDVLIGLLAGLFLAYSLMVTAPPVTIDRFLFSSAILFRLLLLFAMPALSDDVYRFVWDGRLLAHGTNPYLYLPADILNTDIATAVGLTNSLFRQLNSPSYYTVYPPLNQALFGLAARLSGGSLLWNVVWLRVPIVLSELGTMWLLVKLLRRLNRNPNVALLYGLNPLVVLELTGNVHFEAVMIFFTLLAVWLLVTGRLAASAGALGLAIGAKLLPLILLPLILRYLPWRNALFYCAIVGTLIIALFAPFASTALIRNVTSSIGLYFQKFEFNASVYYVIRAIDGWINGYSSVGIIGLGLSITAMLSILWIAFRWRRVSPAAQVLAILTIYFLFATTVHPWYITSLVAASVFTRFRYPVVWSALIALSYATYRTLPYSENLWFTALEYGVVGVVAIFEIRTYAKPDKKAIGREANGFFVKYF